MSLTAKEKVQSLLAAANTATGKSAADLTEGVGDLIAGYGGGGEPPLPSGYTRLKYLKGNGEQYIDIDLCITDDSEITAYSTAVSNRAYQNLYGITDTFAQTNSETGAGFRFQYNYFAGNSGFFISENNQTCTTLSRNGSYILVDICGERIRTLVKGNNITTSVKPDITFAVFARHKIDGTYDYPYAGYVYRFYIEENGERLCDLIPAMRDSDSELGMYDVARNRFFTNIGTGSFTGGTYD